ncbi:MAG: biotin/lipoyl-binding protein [Candidatus Promineofilum sp.]|nr:biotin/lipoyl-binding protein [Promineifilum sp.]MCW5863137.1 acetyl-CoA carboxylase biotin carboxyl carrier protein subunit [Anaerolineae bacterium]
MTSLEVIIDGTTYEVELGLAGGDTHTVKVNGEPLTVTVPRPEAVVTEMDWLIINGWPYELTFDPNMQWLRAYDGLHSVEIHDRAQHVARPRSGDGRVKAPIPGLISRVLVAPGESVVAGQALVILEAMKMENEIRAPFDGVVSSVSANIGETVLRGQVLVEVK